MSGSLYGMSEDATIDYQTLRFALSDAGAVEDPSEVHGTLCGVLCVDESAPAESLVEAESAPGMRQTLGTLRETTLEGLFDPGMGFEPLLPDDSRATLSGRVEALARWCAGFVYGIASRGEFDYGALSDEVREVVRDLTELSKAGLTEEDAGEEQGESDYAELVEYVRVGVQLVFLELRSGRTGDETPARLH